LSSRNQSLGLAEDETGRFQARLLQLSAPVGVSDIRNRTIHQDVALAAPLLPPTCVDLLIADPPYNQTQSFSDTKFWRIDDEDYEAFTESWLVSLLPTLHPEASVYICSDWRSSQAVHRVCTRHLKVRNRITWEREKGRGAKRNWKSACEDIWFCTMARDYYFDVDAVKLKRRVLAPYRVGGSPKDWDETGGGNFRLTHPSNIWTDLTVPFWSMPENTEHPTQKPEKLVAKLILASCPPGGLVLDPFLGVGTTSVVARKLGRDFVGIDIDEYYCCLAEKRLELAAGDKCIQGYDEGVFWERNSGPNRTPRSR